MASNIKIAVGTRNAMGDALIADLGASPLVKVYDGSQPAGPGTAITTQTLLGTLTCSATPAPATSNGVITFNAITQDSSADATGTAAWYRLTTSGGTAIVDGTVGTSGADLNLNTTTIAALGPISVSSFTYTMPGG
jgi:hypothetical protein